ncbi:hypothetical protein Oweho_0370 [Owenweeksia hongkongensis DSM 17368]|uniref:DUF5683 domain-containing protein n=1 Tax=Owenweeksia hongkongensis (strain DSM 17368 / CIP 108786 / JCM 12287 / NRRL B-23963 / UST20020801) TaxID=926562 RepID=G8R8K8_OWEHD|nr:DUF5683 domain-containing protein [Owenweeksia hongkongensis]AEV31390.1 hypothetical protein Oweho_0370 [Owenweeksia hongkongensis DSM 17368]
MKTSGKSHTILGTLCLTLFLLSANFASAQVDSTASDSLSLEDIAPESYTPQAERIYTDSIVGGEKSVEQGDHSPSKAAMLSSTFPGMGQVYNKKYWKVPIVYAAMGAAIYAIIWNQDQYKIYEDAFYSRLDNDLSNDQFAGVYDERQLIELQNFYRQQRDLSIILGAVAYGLNVLDAYVDAHLFYYDVSDDLSLRWEPTIMNNQNYGTLGFGFGVTLSFK